MINEYDYNHEELSQGIGIRPLPTTIFHSLQASRRFPIQNGINSHRKILKDLQLFIQQSKLKDQSRIHELQKKQKNTGDQVHQRQATKQNKRKQLVAKEKERLLKECTFQPKLSKNGPKRNFNEFLQNQAAHTQKIKQKRQMLKKQIKQHSEKPTYKPKINHNRGKGKSRNSRGSTVYERLYALRQKDNCEDIKPLDEQAFHPVINARSKNMIRNKPIDDLLYSDALRRQQKQHQILVTSNSVCSKPQKLYNTNNEKYAAQKFIKQYYVALEDLQINPSIHYTLDYISFDQLLKYLGFMTKEVQFECNMYSTERTLLNDAYNIIEKYNVNARNVCVFLLAIIGIYHINPVNFQENQKPDQSNELNFDESDGKKIHKHFDLFYRNKLSSEPIHKNEQKEEEEHSFQPKINKQSRQMANRHRNAMLEEVNQLIEQYPELNFNLPTDGIISHTDLLVLHKKAKDIDNHRAKYQKQNQELKQCTFKPQTCGSSLSNSKMSTDQLFGYKKSQELYEYHKYAQSKKQSMKSSRSQIDYQCTFKPQINKDWQSSSKISVPMSKQTDETIYRLHKGRAEYQQKKKNMERGESYKKPIKISTCTQQEKAPNLILDVNLGDKVDRIMLYQGDENRLEQVVKQFGHKHNLDVQSQAKLLEMLSSEMDNILQQIEGEEYSNC